MSEQDLTPQSSANSSVDFVSGCSTTQRTETEERFRYEPLKPDLSDRTEEFIRLLYIEPGGKDDQIQCKIRHVGLGEKPMYGALSYTWGTGPSRREIRLNGRPVLVRETLYQALFHLRGRMTAGLWVDAICINQEDIHERNYQVSIMPFIYVRAQVVVIFLDCALSQGYGSVPSSSEAKSQNCSDLEIQDDYYTDVRLRAFQGSNAEGYWNRAWIVQEIGIAQDIRVHFRHVAYTWQEFHGIIVHQEKRMPGYPRTWTSALYDRIRLLDKIRRNRYGVETCLERLLEDFRLAQCADPYDHIFAFLGLAQDCSSSDLEADYRWSPYELFERMIDLFRKRLLNEEGGDNTFDRSMRLMRYATLVQRLLAKCCIAPPVNEMRSSPILLARATAVCVLVDIGPSYKDYMRSHKAYQCFENSIRHSGSVACHTREIRNLCFAFLERLGALTAKQLDKVFDLDAEILKSWGIDTDEMWWQDERKWHQATREGKDPFRLENFAFGTEDYVKGQEDHSPEQEDKEWVGGDNDTEPDDISGVQDSLLQKQDEVREQTDMSSGPHLFFAQGSSTQATSSRIKKYIGLVPPLAKEGDILCRFWNCGDLTVLLRLQSGGHYSIVGTAYLEHIETLSKPTAQRVAYQLPTDHNGKVYHIRLDIKTLQHLTRSSSLAKTHDKCGCRESYNRTRS